MQNCPAVVQSACFVHCGNASAAVRQTLSVPQYPMRASISLQLWSVAQVNLQKPFTQLWFEPHADLSVSVQIVFGRVSVAHAPLLQYLPAPHSPSLTHAGTHAPLTHLGVGAAHWASPVHWVDASGWQTPFVQV